MMSLKPSLRNAPGIFPAILSVSVFLHIFTFGFAAIGQDKLSKPQAGVIETNLEGIQFVGPFGAEGEAAPKEDTFTFKDGKFATGSCLEWGFTPAPYWVRRDANGVHFLAELESPEHGTMRYEGVFDGKELTIAGYWKKERWYWTIERTYRGKGRPAALGK